MSGSWQTWTSANSGLPADHVTDVVQDARGDLWLATYGGGLARCSEAGRDWQVLRAGRGGPFNDYVGALALDPAGRLWAVCDARRVEGLDIPGAVSVLAPDGTWQHHPRPAGEGCLRFLEAGRDGRMWFRMGGTVASDAPTRCLGLREGSDRYYGGQWLTWDGSAWNEIAEERAAAAAWYPQRPARTRLGWAQERERLWLLETVAPSLETPESPPGFSLPLAISANLGVFMNRYQLACFDGRSWGEPFELPSPYRYGELAVDARGDKWVSLIMLGDIVILHGVARLQGGAGAEAAWTCFDRGSGLPYDYVGAITADARGGVWCSHLGGDLSRWDGAGWAHLPGGEEGRGKEPLGRAFEDGQGRLWFPSRAGVVVGNH